MAEEKSFYLIKDFNFVVHQNAPKEFMELDMESVNLDLNQPCHPSDFRSSYLIEYFRDQKKANGALKYFTFAAHYDQSTKRTLFSFTLKKKVMERLYSTLPNLAIVFRGYVEGQGMAVGSFDQVPLESPSHIRINLRELITSEAWKDNADIYSETVLGLKDTRTYPSSAYFTQISKGRLDILVGWKETARVKSIQTSAQYFMEKLLEDESNKDLTIVAGNGAEIKCHKIIFSAHCPAFSRMFSSDTAMKEATSGTFEMLENSEEGVRLLIRYLYGVQLVIRDLSVDVAVELFQTAHKYDLSHLEESLLRLFMKKGASWFTPDAMLELYLFAKKLDALKKLQDHCVLLMTGMNMKDLRSSDIFKKMDSSDSIELVDSMKNRVPKSDQRGIKRQKDGDDDEEDEYPSWNINDVIGGFIPVYRK